MPTPARENLGYGGNTSCAEIRGPNGELLIIDAGTGIRNLGLSLVEEFGDRPLDLNVLLTHFHWDHIQGMPFFAPLYGAGNTITFRSFPAEHRICEVLRTQMSSPYFPVDFSSVPARCKHVQVRNGLHPFGDVPFGDIKVTSFPMNHPQGACGYRVESAGAVIVYASDLEHGHPELDRVVRDFSAGADVLIYDAQYTPEEYERKKGWGHSTWLEAAKVARDAKVKQLILFHHDPSHDDAMLDGKVRETRQYFENAVGAREGWTVQI